LRTLGVVLEKNGEIVAMASTLEDELVVAKCDLDLVQLYRTKLWNFARNRRIEHYGPITAQRGEQR
ncbi:MAG TPA: hypothetical protein PKE45_21810, partial [Caldilineaceae bacterium]|nr:hypothetical protein [Caldilineaceae bacterium]